MGFKLTAEDVYSINHASLKDAVVLFGGGCTGGVISNDGLLITNHHCGFGEIQEHSSIEHDYLTNGFWAMNKSEELTNPGLTVQFLVKMEDVSEKILKNVKEKIEKALSKVRAALQQDGGDIELVSVENGVVKVRLKGACAGCPMSQMTMANFVEAELKKAVPEVKRVQAV